MSTIVMLSVIYTILSSILIHPWYIKGLLKGKTLFKHYKSYYKLDSYERFIIYLFSFLTLIFFQLFFWTGFNFGINILYPPFIPKEFIFFIAMFQFSTTIVLYCTNLRNNVHFKYYFTIIAIITLLAIFTTKDKKVENIKIPNFETYCKEEIDISYIIPSKEIAKKGEITLYKENDTQYVISNNDKSEIIIIDINSNKVMEDISINNSLSIDLSSIRKNYPYQLLKVQDFAIIDNKIFRIISIIDAKPFSTEIDFSCFILINCENGDIIKI